MTLDLTPLRKSTWGRRAQTMGGQALKDRRAMRLSKLRFTITPTPTDARSRVEHFTLLPPLNFHRLMKENIFLLTIVRALSERSIPQQKRSPDLQQEPLRRLTSKLAPTAVSTTLLGGQALS